jgi:hypothetical protein
VPYEQAENLRRSIVMLAAPPRLLDRLASTGIATLRPRHRYEPARRILEPLELGVVSSSLPVSTA